MIIRRIPQDFMVREVLTGAWREGVVPEPSRAAPFAVYELTKTSLTTPQAAGMLAKELGLKPGGVEYGGLKDKHAVTTQHVTVRVSRAEVESPASLTREGWNASLLGYTGAHIAASAIKRNVFEIVVRDATQDDFETVARRAEHLTARDTDLRIVNYFGAQRFGSARHGSGWIGERLCKGDFEGALRLALGTPDRKDSGARRAMTRALATHWGRWKEALADIPRCPERRAIELLARGAGFKEAFTDLPHEFQQLCVEAYQSHLWNRTVRALVTRHWGRESLLIGEDEYGEMLFPRGRDIEPALGGLEIPMLASDSKLRDPWAVDAEQALREAGVALPELKVVGVRRPAFREVQRALFVYAFKFSVGRPEADDLGRPGRWKVTVGFELPRGAYATVVLRALGQ